MSALTVNGVPVISGSVYLPRIGPWSAELTTARPLEAGPCVMVDAGGAWVGTAGPSGGVGGIYTSKVVGGSGGLKTQLGPAHWRGTTVGAVLAASLAEAGEAPSPLILPAISGAALPFWTRAGGSLAAVLGDLAETAGVSWRVLRDGTVWLGIGRPETVDPATTAPLVMDVELGRDVIEIAPEVLFIIPGDVVGGLPVHAVRYEISNTMRATVWVGLEGEDA